MNERVVVALGGNALLPPCQTPTMDRQIECAHSTLRALTPLLAGDAQILVSHGNGPQVGQILARTEAAVGTAYALTLEACVAESEGELGYIIEQAMRNVLHEAASQRPVVTLLTQVVVAKDDPAWAHPTKPIGMILNAEQAEIARQRGQSVHAEAGRGLRRVVASPRPQEILELEVIRKLLELKVVVIAAGGGGIPVVRRNGKLVGVEAVIDKDLTAALLADGLDADLLLILTDVPCAYTNWRTAQQQPIGCIDRGEAERLLVAGHFAAGSMREKIEAAMLFANHSSRRAIVTDPRSVVEALAGRAGTIVRGPRDAAVEVAST